MKRSGIAYLPLHGGTAPPWLVKRMTMLADAIVKVIIEEYGVDELLRRLSDSFWFQALGCVLGYDWHSSGVTTVTTGVLKMVLKPEKYGIAVAGGKGLTSRKTPSDLEQIGKKFDFSEDFVEKLKYTSRLIAKVDNTALQDGFNLYHHSFIVSADGKWAVIQQGMDPELRVARRYHWLHENVKSFVNEPHTMIASEIFKRNVLDMTAKESEEGRKTSLDLVREGPKHLVQYVNKLRNPKQTTLISTGEESEILKRKVSVPVLIMPRSINWNALERAYELNPKTYEELLSVRGIGPAVIRALALVSELIWGAKVSWKDPAKYSFAHGGKDGVPYPVNIKRMEEVATFLSNAIEEAKIGQKDKLRALKRLSIYSSVRKSEQ